MPTLEQTLAAAGYTVNDDGSVKVPKRDPEKSSKLVSRHYLNRIVWCPPLDEEEVYAEVEEED